MPNRRDEIADRIQGAMDRAELSLAGLQQEVERLTTDPETGKPARGSSYTALRSYLNAEVVNPRPEILKAIADATGCRREWMLTGEGAPTVKGAVERRALERARAGEWLYTLFDALESALDDLPPAFNKLLWPYEARESIVRTVMELFRPKPGDSVPTEAVELVAWLYLMPMIALRKADPVPLREGRIYALSMHQAMIAAMPDKGKADPDATLEWLRAMRRSIGSVGFPGLTPEGD